MSWHWDTAINCFCFLEREGGDKGREAGLKGEGGERGRGGKRGMKGEGEERERGRDKGGRRRRRTEGERKEEGKKEPVGRKEAMQRECKVIIFLFFPLTHHSREDELHALDSCLGLVLPAIGTVVECEQTLANWVGVRHCRIVQECDLTDTPSLRMRTM